MRKILPKSWYDNMRTLYSELDEKYSDSYVNLIDSVDCFYTVVITPEFFKDNDCSAVIVTAVKDYDYQPCLDLDIAEGLHD